MKTIAISFRSMLVLPYAHHAHLNVYVITALMLYLVLITMVLSFFKINKRGAGDEEL